MNTAPNTRRHTSRYLTGFALLFLFDLLAIIGSKDIIESCILLFLFMVNLFAINHFSS
jgi:hypothetical protein